MTLVLALLPFALLHLGYGAALAALARRLGAGREPWAWLPGPNLLLPFVLAGRSPAWGALLLVPAWNVIVWVQAWAEVFARLHRPAWTAVGMAVPGLNLAGRPIDVLWSVADASARIRNDIHTNDRVVLTGEGALGAWDYRAAVNYGRSQRETQAGDGWLRVSGIASVQGTTSRTLFLDPQLNPFGLQDAAGLALLDKASMSGQTLRLHKAENASVDATFSRSLMKLSGGNMMLALGTELRRDTWKAIGLASNDLSAALNGQIDLLGGDNIASGANSGTSTRISRDTDGSPNYYVVRPGDDQLFNCPVIFASDAGTIGFTAPQADRLRQYFLKGGFLWADDFWGTAAWENWEYQIGRVLPPDEFPIEDVPLDDPILRSQFELKEIPQITNIQFWRQWNGTNTSERAEDSADVHFRAIRDSHGRIMVLMTHNTDVADSWEREGEDPDFFYQFSPRGYALGVDVLLHVLTH